MSDAAATGVTLRALRELGVRLVLDDFGTGYSSLAYLSEMALDSIKVDRAFVAGLGVPGANHSIIAAVSALAHGLGLEVTAEGIEETDQLAAVIDLGCDRGQGFLFAPPLPALEAEVALVRDRARSQAGARQRANARAGDRLGDRAGRRGVGRGTSVRGPGPSLSGGCRRAAAA